METTRFHHICRAVIDAMSGHLVLMREMPLPMDGVHTIARWMLRLAAIRHWHYWVIQKALDNGGLTAPAYLAALERGDHNPPVHLVFHSSAQIRQFWDNGWRGDDRMFTGCAVGGHTTTRRLYEHNAILKIWGLDAELKMTIPLTLNHGDHLRSVTIVYSPFRLTFIGFIKGALTTHMAFNALRL